MRKPQTKLLPLRAGQSAAAALPAPASTVESATGQGGLWQELHRPFPPIGHPIPRLDLPVVPPPGCLVLQFVPAGQKLRILLRSRREVAAAKYPPRQN